MTTIQPSANCSQAIPVSLATTYSTSTRQALPDDGGWLSFDCQTNTFIGGHVNNDQAKEIQITWYFGCDNQQGSVTVTNTASWNPGSGAPTGTPAFTIASGSYSGPIKLRIQASAGGTVSLYLADTTRGG